MLMSAFWYKRHTFALLIGFAMLLATIQSILPAPTALATSLALAAPAETGSISAASQQVPLSLRRKAAQQIEDVRFSSMAPGWEQAQLGSPIRELYRPDVDGVAYYEFPVIVRSQPAGFIILSADEHDYPVAHWSAQGEPPTHLLERQATAEGQPNLKFYKLDALAYAAENSHGELVASSETKLTRIIGLDQAALNASDELSESSWRPDPSESDSDIMGQSGGQLIKTGPVSPTISLKGWDSWEQLKHDYHTSYGVLTESLRRKARSDWNIDRMAAQYGEGLAQGTTYPLALLPGVSDITATGDGVSYVSTRTVRRTGLPPVFTITVLGSEPEATPSLDVKISYTDGQAELLTFFIVPAAPSTSAAADGQGSTAALQSSSTSAWSPWTFYWTGDGKDGNDQRLYSQIAAGQTPNTSSCFSGCGGTAWAMLFGWADNQAAIGNSAWAPRWGIYRQNGGFGTNVGAPRTMDAGVRNMTWEIRNRIGTFCFFSNGATPPWSMDEAAGYLVGRSGASLTTHYNIFGNAEDRLRDYAIKSIKNRHTPAIIGIGLLSHYPLAYGYAVQSRVVHTCIPPNGQPPFTTVCYDYTEYNRWFYVNQGGGSSTGSWVPASTWFAGEIAP
jgi:hypothetical protein